MADYSCDFCVHDNQCPYAYDQLDCFVETIKSAKAIVDDEFETFLAKMVEKNEDICDDNLDVLIQNMRNIICDSKRPLPDWATQAISVVQEE